MKSFVSILLLILMLLFCVSCASDNPKIENTHSQAFDTQIDSIITELEGSAATTLTTTDYMVSDESTNPKPIQSTTASTEDNSSKYYEIDLNLNNYRSYLNYSSKNGLNDRRQIVKNYIHTVSGTLPYAYYENVVITFKVTCIYSGQTYEFPYPVTLDAAGNAEFNLDDIGGLSKSGSSISISIAYVAGKVVFSL